MPRLTPITTKSALPTEHQPVADKVVEVFGHIRGPFSMLLHSPKLAEQLLPLVTFVRHETIIKPNHRFAAILTAARERDAAYVWAAYAANACVLAGLVAWLVIDGRRLQRLLDQLDASGIRRRSDASGRGPG